MWPTRGAGASEPRQVPRERLSASVWPGVVYAVGDVHGCLRQLIDLERAIIDDATAVEGERWLVMLGDYVDRGPDSAGVISHLLRPPPPRFRRIALAGNHEQMMLDFLSDPRGSRQWLELGGQETAHSYGLMCTPEERSPRRLQTLAGKLEQAIPADHVALLRTLPISLSLPGFRFVHAGLKIGVDFEAQTDDDMLWIRPSPEDGRWSEDATVVRGHVPAPEPLARPGDICVDTGVHATGVLTCVRLEPGTEPRFIRSNS